MKKLLVLMLGFVLLAQTTAAQVDLNDPLAMGGVLISELDAVVAKVNDYWQSHNSTTPSNGQNTITGREPHRRTRASGSTRPMARAWIMCCSPTGKSAFKSISTSTNWSIVLSALNGHWM